MDVKEGEATDRWLGRPWLSRAVRFGVYAAPFLCSIFSALALSRLIPMADSWPVAIGRLLAIAAGSTVVLYVADRATRRLLPLAALLNLTLVFPDEAPSRFKIALRAGGTTELRRRLDEYRRVGANEPALAAQRLLELVADLSRHDRLTRGHSERVRAYSQMIGEELGLSESEIDKLRWAALLHDIGKLEIPFEILNKPGRLTDEEFDTIKRHPAIGAALAAPMAGWLGQSVRAVGEHHERWDGKGYPKGLRGTDISLAARIVAVADTFDVMTSLRSYKKPGTAAEARAELARCAGTQFDANVVRAFLSISLGKLRLAMGPLSWLTQLTLFPTGMVGATATAPALMAIAGVTAATLGATVAPNAESAHAAPPAAIAVVEHPGRTDESSVIVATSSGVPERTSSGVSNTNVDSATIDGPGSTSTGSTPPDTVAANGGPQTATTVPTRGAVDETVPVRPLPTSTPAPAATASPTTAGPAAETSTTASPAPPPPATTAAPTTAPPTTPPPTTTLPPPTTTLPPDPPSNTMTYLLASSAPGNVSSQVVLPMAARAPLNAGALPNLDTDRDNRPGRVLKKDSSLGFGLGGTERIQRFRLDPAEEIRLNGPVSLLLFAAARDFHDKRIEARAALVDCIDVLGACSIFATETVDFTGGDDYTPITFDFGSQSRTLAASHNLELWIVATSGAERDMWIAYDTPDTRARSRSFPEIS